MLTDETVPAEGARYRAPLVLVPGLWCGREVWRGFATYLAHRGWECRLVDLRGVGGFEARRAALKAYLTALPAPAVLVGHGAGGLVAQAAAADAAAAVAILAPLIATEPATRALVLGLRRVLAVALGGRVPPPQPAIVDVLLGDLPARERATVTARLAADDGAAVRDVVRGRVHLAPASVPTLVVAGGRDPFAPAPAVRELATQIGAEVETLPEGGHWLLAGPAWQAAVAVVHRWVVQRLGEPLLEIYAETMAERDAGDD